MHNTIKNKIIVISGPGGAGKTTLLKRLFLRKAIKSNFIRSISYTTRSFRPGESPKKDYFFVNPANFSKLIKEDFFLEYQKVSGYYYGTPKYFVQKANLEHKNLVLCIDVKGRMYLKNHFKRYTIAAIFISAPDTGELIQRLHKRGDISIIKKRIALAKKELQFSQYYNYLIINKDIQKSLDLLESIFAAERIRKN